MVFVCMFGLDSAFEHDHWIGLVSNSLAAFPFLKSCLRTDADVLAKAMILFRVSHPMFSAEGLDVKPNDK